MLTRRGTAVSPLGVDASTSRQAGAAVVFVIGPIYLDRLRRELSRADEMAEIAHRLGLAFTPSDPAYPSSTAFRFPFELFSRGVDQACENFITGTIKGVDLIAFD